MLKLYNTLTRIKEDFIPITKNKVKMYSCGPTVYSYAHIGNMRSYIFMDLLKRILIYNGYEVTSVMNITDVGHLLSDGDTGEDKMEQAGKELEKSPYEIAAIYSEAFFKDLNKLNILRPEITPKATDHITEMLDFVIQLYKKGFGYETSDGIYFDISKFIDYGKLSRLNLDNQIAGARVEVNQEKRNPADFALWKKAPQNHIMQWPSPWGMGYPGWHIECSAMSKKYLGEIFDIHTGGVDHIPVHHENEIAQSEALEGHKTVNYWMHGEFMLVDGGKMSKSLKNTYTLDELEKKGYSPLAFRYFCLNTHYRKKLNFTFEGLDGAQTAYNRLLMLVNEHKKGSSTIPEEIILNYKKQFIDAINDDLNVPLALGLIWTMLKEKPSKEIYNLCLSFDNVLGLSLDNYITPSEKISEIPQNVIDLALKRAEARKNRNFALSDTLRDKILEYGFKVIDKKDGYDLEKI